MDTVYINSPPADNLTDDAAEQARVRATYTPGDLEPYRYILPSDTPDVWEDTGDATMYRTMRKFAPELLVAATLADAELLSLDSRSGTWVHSGLKGYQAPLHQFVAETEREWAGSATAHFVFAAIDKTVHGKVVNWAKKMANHAARTMALPAAGRVWAAWKTSPDQPEALTVCEPKDINAETRYLGFPNGVVDLHNGALLSPEEGRRHLISRRCYDDYNPDAQDDRVDALLTHLDADVEEFLWAAAGYALWGNPSRRIYLLRGPHNAGKSTWQGLMTKALGDVKEDGYGLHLQTTALVRDSFGNSSGHQENLIGVQDARIMTASELPGGAVGATLDTSTLKTLDGVVSLSLRPLGQTQGAARPATATLFLSINDVDGPKIDYSDPALVDRIVLVDFPELETELHGGFAKELFADANARQGMMARLVREAAVYSKGGWQPPPLPDSVRASTDEQAAEAIGELPAWFLANIELVPSAAEVFCTATQIWAAAPWTWARIRKD